MVTTGMPRHRTGAKPPAGLAGGFASRASDASPAFGASEAGGAAIPVMLAFRTRQNEGQWPRALLVRVCKLKGKGNELLNHGREQNVVIDHNLPGGRSCHTNLTRYNKTQPKLGRDKLPGEVLAFNSQ
jgi:hypothetical protein